MSQQEKLKLIGKKGTLKRERADFKKLFNPDKINPNKVTVGQLSLLAIKIFNYFDSFSDPLNQQLRV